MKKLDDFTAQELIGELRLRERRAGGAAGTKTRNRSAPPPNAGRSLDLERVPSAKLAKLAQDRQRVIYGVDDRKDIYKLKSSRVLAAANAVVALVKATDLKLQVDGSYVLKTQKFGDAYSLCGSEPFINQPTGCFCSGSLVGPDVIATAGHCVKNDADLATMRFVFGFRMINATKARTVFPANDVYKGKKLIGRKLSSDGTDWALVQLDRAVVGHAPVKFRKTGKIADQQSIFVIGHPCGLPQKYAGGAAVRDNAPTPYFVANLDTYGGNSGSPVFNAQNTVEGVLVRGENDFVSNGGCYVSMVCPTTGCRGEDVTRATVWSGKVPSTGTPATAGAKAKKRTSKGSAKKRPRSARR
jgi:hypothetical protein